MDEKVAIKKNEVMDGGNDTELEKHKSLLLAQLDTVLGLSHSSCDAVYASEKSTAKQMCVEDKPNSSLDVGVQQKDKLANLTHCFDAISSLPAEQDAQNAEGNLKKIIAEEKKFSGCAMEYNGVYETSVTDCKREGVMEYNKGSCEPKIPDKIFERPIPCHKSPCESRVTNNNGPRAKEYTGEPHEENSTIGNYKGTSEHKRPCVATVTDSNFEGAVGQEQDNYQPLMTYTFEAPILALDYREEFSASKSNFTKGCKWAPDGSCLLVGSDDRKLRLLNLPTPIVQGEFQSESWFMGESEKYARAAITVQENELIYDYAWFPLMQSSDPRTCCFAVTCRDHPVHLWDAWDGQLICSYHSYDHLDQLVGAYSIGFNQEGSHLLCGFKKCIRVFHTSRPGRYFETIDSKGQPGIISCMAFNPQLPCVFAAGSYLGTLGLYNLQSNNLFCRMEGCLGGVTHVQFSSDGTKLFSGTRKNNEILCWDIRNLGTILCGYKREVSTNQRIYFDLEPQLNRFLISGDTKGQVLKWDLSHNNEGTSAKEDIPLLMPSSSFTAHKDCTNGVSIHPYCPIVATSSGQRHFPEPISECDSDSSYEDDAMKPLFTRQKIKECSVKLWWLGG
nr:telomerase Cajal body protein 1-like [Cherax quadricarinatus]XP_053652278.1 telomerase Cajal body protein 1-like [Cherax quadricarinatus]XP_053652279.1 telomerase Cajal body protein 1-like [Cherax quadricarinatus]